jgi:hypothetical protein
MAWDGRLLVIGFVAGIPDAPTNHALLKNYSIVGVHWGASVARRPASLGEQMRSVLDLAASGAVDPPLYPPYRFETRRRRCRTWRTARPTARSSSSSEATPTTTRGSPCGGGSRRWGGRCCLRRPARRCNPRCSGSPPCRATTSTCATSSRSPAHPCGRAWPTPRSPAPVPGQWWPSPGARARMAPPPRLRLRRRARPLRLRAPERAGAPSHGRRPPSARQAARPHGARPQQPAPRRPGGPRRRARRARACGRRGRHPDAGGGRRRSPGAGPGEPPSCRTPTWWTSTGSGDPVRTATASSRAPRHQTGERRLALVVRRSVRSWPSSPGTLAAPARPPSHRRRAVDHLADWTCSCSPTASAPTRASSRRATRTSARRSSPPARPRHLAEQQPDPGVRPLLARSPWRAADSGALRRAAATGGRDPRPETPARVGEELPKRTPTVRRDAFAAARRHADRGLRRLARVRSLRSVARRGLEAHSLSLASGVARPRQQRGDGVRRARHRPPCCGARARASASPRISPPASGRRHMRRAGRLEEHSRLLTLMLEPGTPTSTSSHTTRCTRPAVRPWPRIPMRTRKVTTLHHPGHTCSSRPSPGAASD